MYYDEEDILTSAELVREFPKTFRSQNSVAYMVNKFGLPHRRVSPRKLQFSRSRILEWLANKERGGGESPSESKLKSRFVS